MKKLVVIVVLLVGFVAGVNAQTVLVDKKKTRQLEEKISECQAKINRLDRDLSGVKDYSADIKSVRTEMDSLGKLNPDTKMGKDLKANALTSKAKALKELMSRQVAFDALPVKQAEKNLLEAQMKQYEKAKSEIFDSFIADNSAPKELTPRELKRRARGNYNRREELVFNKLEKNPVIGDQSGLEGIICNKYPVPVLFRFSPLDGGESKSLLVNSGNTIREKLIPGKYQVSFYDGGREIGRPCVFTANAVVNSFDGTPCHWFAYMPRF